MTGSQKQEANDKKLEMYIKAGCRCFECGRHLRLSEAQLAHRIPKHKKYLKKYGPDVIHHELNMRISCSGCNSVALLDPATHPVEVAELVDRIREELK